MSSRMDMFERARQHSRRGHARSTGAQAPTLQNNDHKSSVADTFKTIVDILQPEERDVSAATPKAARYLKWKGEGSTAGAEGNEPGK